MQTITTEEDYQARKEQLAGLRVLHDEILSSHEKDLAEWEVRQVKMQEVVSSNIAAAGFVPGPEGKPGNLYVDFKGAGTATRYVYADVPEDVYQALLDAASAGQFLNQHIKGTYAARCTRL